MKTFKKYFAGLAMVLLFSLGATIQLAATMPGATLHVITTMATLAVKLMR